jgi:hypothetical protein
LLTVDDLLDLYFGGLDADSRVSGKTLADCRKLRPLLGGSPAWVSESR